MLSFMVFEQLDEPILIAPFNTLCERVALLGTKFPRFAAKLEEPTYKLSHYIPQDLLQDHLYIIVQTLNAGKLSSCIPCGVVPHSTIPSRHTQACSLPLLLCWY